MNYSTHMVVISLMSIVLQKYAELFKLALGRGLCALPFISS